MRVVITVFGKDDEELFNADARLRDDATEENLEIALEEAYRAARMMLGVMVPEEEAERLHQQAVEEGFYDGREGPVLVREGTLNPIKKPFEVTVKDSGDPMQTFTYVVHAEDRQSALERALELEKEEYHA